MHHGKAADLGHVVEVVILITCQIAEYIPHPQAVVGVIGSHGRQHQICKPGEQGDTFIQN